MVVFAHQCLEDSSGVSALAFEPGIGVGLVLGDKDWAVQSTELNPDPVDLNLLELPEPPSYVLSYKPHEFGLGFEASIELMPTELSLQGIQADPTIESSGEVPIGPWMEKVTARFAELLALEQGWNSHGGRPIDPANVSIAGRFLATVMDPSTPAPIIVPTGGGGLQLEWHRAGLDVELLFGEEDSPELYVADISSGREWEGSPVEGFAEFELAQRLIG